MPDTSSEADHGRRLRSAFRRGLNAAIYPLDDDRGRPVPPFRRPSAWFPQVPPGFTRDDWRSICRVAQDRAGWSVHVGFILIGVVWILVGAWFLRFWLSHTTLPTISALMALVGLAFAGRGACCINLGARYGLMLPKVPPARLKSAFLSVARCARCGYKLPTMNPDPDGCTICPECGAAWRLPQTPAHPPA